MTNKDVKITRIYEGKYGDFSLTLCIKSEDINEEAKKALRALWTTGDTVDIDITLHNDKENQVTVEDAIKKQQSIYQKFKLDCEYWGIDYKKVKERLGVEHLRELEDKFPPNEIAMILKQELEQSKELIGIYNNNY